MAHEQRQIHFRGRVQGVGFRYTTCDVAAGFEITGFVQNLPDGRVLVVAEGEPAELDEFIAAIQQQMRSYISGTQTSVTPASGQFDGFQVRY